MTGDRRVCGTRFSIRIDWIELSTPLNQFEMLISSLIHKRTLKNVMFYKKIVLREKHVNIKCKSRISLFSYTDVMNHMNVLVVVTLSSIYHLCISHACKKVITIGLI